MVELGFRPGKMRFRFASYAPRPFYVCATLNSFEFFFAVYSVSEYTLPKKMI